jgi:hypothetical protein
VQNRPLTNQQAIGFTNLRPIYSTPDDVHFPLGTFGVTGLSANKTPLFIKETPKW